MRTLFLAAVLALAPASACSKDDAAKTASDKDLPEITVEDAEKAIAANQATAIDCNGDGTRKKHGIIPGAVLVTDDEAYAPGELPADKARKLIFYCSGPG